MNTSTPITANLSPPAARHRLLPALLAIIACLFWASAFAFVKIGLRYTTPLTLAGLRFLLAGVLLLACCGKPRRTLTLVRENWRVVSVICLFQTLLQYAFFFWGMTLVRGAQAAIITGCSPLLAAVLAHALLPNDRLSLRRFLSLGAGLAGVITLSLASHPWSATGLRELGGMLLLLLSQAAGVGGDITYARAKGQGLPPVLVNGVQMGAGGLLLFGLALLLEGAPHLHAQPLFLFALLWLAIISAVGFSLWFYLLNRVKVSALNVWKFLIPVFGAALSWLLLPGESPDLLSILGMLLIAGSIVAFFVREDGNA